MSKLPTTEQTRDISDRIDNGDFLGAIKSFQNITSAGLPNAKRVIELQTQGPRCGMARVDILAAYDELWGYFMSLQMYGDMAQRREATIKELTNRTKHLETLYDAAQNERDEYKSRLNAMRTTAGLEPLSTQSAPNPDSGFLTVDPEISVMSSAVDMLYGLCPEDRCRVLDYLQRRFE